MHALSSERLLHACISGDIIKLIQLRDESKPSGLVWVQFDYEDVGKKTQRDNRNLYCRGIESTWTPIKSITTQFTVGRTKSAQVVSVLARSLVSLVSGDQPPRLRSSKSGTVYFVLDEVSHVHNTRLRTVLLFSR